MEPRYERVVKVALAARARYVLAGYAEREQFPVRAAYIGVEVVVIEAEAASDVDL